MISVADLRWSISKVREQVTQAKGQHTQWNGVPLELSWAEYLSVVRTSTPEDSPTSGTTPMGLWGLSFVVNYSKEPLAPLAERIAKIFPTTNL